MGSFVFKWPHPEANDVHVTGTFDDWGKSVRLDKVGDTWEKEVDLPNDKKILYKFVVNDQWIIDPQAPQEDDGHGNVNNVLHPEQIKPKASVVPEAVTTSSVAPESTTAALAGQVPLEPKKEASEVAPGAVPGTFPETPSNEPDTYGVKPLPATEGAGNPVDLPAGEKVPPPGDVTSNTVDSTVTTSKEDYEKAGTGIPIIGGALAALGLGGAAAAVAKKEDLIPESSLPMGSGAGESLDAGPTVSSAGPTSTTADLAGKVPLEETKPATEIDSSAQATTSTVPEVVKESIAEAHTDPEAAKSPEVVKEKAEVEQELLKKVPEHDEAGEPAPTTAAITSATAPSATLGTSSAAAAAVADGADGTAEPIDSPKTTVAPEKTEGDNTEYAPPHAASSAPGVSGSAAAAVSDGAEDPTLLDEPAVQMMNQNEAEASGAPAAEPAVAPPTTEAAKASEPAAPAPEAKKEELKAATPAAPTSATSTPTKKAETTPTTTPSSSGTKEKKKKHRVSSFFKKIFD